jgi:hypothetical protein
MIVLVAPPEGVRSHLIVSLPTAIVLDREAG